LTMSVEASRLDSVRARLGPCALAAALAVSPAATARADEHWFEVRSAHFRVLTDGSEGQAREAAKGFEQLRAVFQGLGMTRVDPPAPIDIVAARNESSLRRFIPWFWEQKGRAEPAGVFLSGTDKHYIVVNLDAPPEARQRVVYHEYSHLVVRLSLGNLPLWLNEGLATFYEMTRVRADRVEIGHIDPVRLRYLRSAHPMSIADLFAIEGGSREYQDRGRVQLFYAESSVLTHYLFLGDGGRHREGLLRYLRLLADGTPEGEAQKDAFGDLKALESGFFGYLNRLGYPVQLVDLDVAATQATSRSLSEAESLAVRGDVLARRYRDAEARPLLMRARELDPRLALASQALGRLEWHADRFAAARQWLSEAIALAPDDFISHYLWARARRFDAKDDLEATEAALRRSLERNPAFAPAHAALSDVLRTRGRLEDAFLSIHKACQLEPSEASNWLRRVDLLRELKRPEIADKIETWLAQTAPADPSQLAALTSYYRREHRLEDAERLLRRAGELNPRRTQPALMLAQLLKQQGRGEEAEAQVRRALSTQPDNPMILNNLAYLEAERSVKLEEALDLVERALKIRPEDAALLDTKGWVLFRIGRLDEAERCLRRSLELGEDVERLDHLGDVLDRRGQRPAAEEQWRRALELSSATEEHKAELRRKLGAAATPPPPAAADGKE
jgi:tetratricopeptide (TPR) repeat protein